MARATRAPADRIARRRGVAGGPAKLAALVLATIVLAIASLAGAIVGATRASNPEIALRFDPSDGGALVADGERRMIVAAGAPVAGLDLTGRRALRDTPLNPGALRLVAIGDATRDPRARSFDLLGLAQRLSRRDWTTQLFLIERASAAGDVPATLAHYDLALRTKPQLGERLFPVLASALSNETIATAFTRYAREPAPWLAAFLTQSMATPDSNGLALLVLKAGGLPARGQLPALQGRIVRRLIGDGSIDTARRVYRALRGADPARTTSARLEVPSDGAFDPLLWQGGRADLVAGDIAVDPRSGQAQIVASAAAGERGVVARKLLMLPAGTYRLAASYAQVALGTGGAIGWAILCPSSRGDPDTWTRRIEVAPGASVAIPADCPAQSLTVSLAADTDTPASVTIRSVALSPIG